MSGDLKFLGRLMVLGWFILRGLMGEVNFCPPNKSIGGGRWENTDKQI